jgi:hypothetical protein
MTFKRLVDKNLEIDSITGTTTSDPIDCDGAETLSVQCVVAVTTPTAKTFDSGVAASVVVGDLTYTAATRGAAGNSITVEYEDTATAGNETVTVLGTDILIGIESGVSTATEIKAAFDAEPDAVALAAVAVTGTGSNAQSTTPETALENGVDSEVDVTANTLRIPAHGLPVGLKGQLTTTGTLPTGLSTGTDYFVIPVDADTIKLANSLANALAGAAVVLSSQGTSGAVNTFTPTALAGGSVKLQKSNDKTNWSDEGSATNITQSGSVWLEKDRPGFKWARVSYTLTSGSLSSDNHTVVKG